MPRRAQPPPAAPQCGLARHPPRTLIAVPGSRGGRCQRSAATFFAAAAPSRQRCLLVQGVADRSVADRSGTETGSPRSTARSAAPRLPPCPGDRNSFSHIPKRPPPPPHPPPPPPATPNTTRSFFPPRAGELEPPQLEGSAGQPFRCGFDQSWRTLEPWGSRWSVPCQRRCR
eukprot:SAG31_NODE_1677_length_7533_cov_2.288054_7_plen_172_part_00